jgi:tetratricopeptide (TPR) repeat protein
MGKKTIKGNKLIISEKKNGYVLPLIIAFCLPVLLYLQTIKFRFTHFDDDYIIINNISFLSHLRNVFRAFITDALMLKMNSSAFYRPLQTVSYIIDIQLSGGNNTWMYHLSNILFLGLISCSLFLLLKRFFITSKLALLGALIYCAHPLFVSTIAWIPARGDLLLTFFSLLSFLFLIEFLQKRKLKYLFLNWATFTIGLFCKETAAFLPFLFIIYFFIFSKESPFKKIYLFMLMLYVISGIFWLWLRTIAIGNFSDPFAEFGLKAFLVNVRTIPESLAKFFLPFDFSPIPGFSILKTLAGLGIIVIIIVLFFKNKKRSKKEFIFCFSWFLILMLPPMLFKNPVIDYLDHRFFLPLIGVQLFILFLLPKKLLMKRDVKISWILIAILVFLSSFTFIKSRSYSDPMTFYNSAIAYNSNSALAYDNRGIIKGEANDVQGAIGDFNKAIAINPNFAEAYSNRGIAKASINDYHGAIEDHNKAIAISPKYADAYNNKGMAIGSIGNYNEAIINFSKAIECKPNYIEAFFNRALAKYYLKDFKGAVEDCEKVLKLNPNIQNAINLKEKAQQELQKSK